MNKAKYRLAALLLLLSSGLFAAAVYAAPTDVVAARISGGAATVALAALLRGDDRLLQLQIVSRKESHAGLVSFSVDRSVGQAAAQAQGLRFVGWGLLVEGQAACRLAVQPPAVQLRSRCEAGWIVREWDATPLVGNGVSFTLADQQAINPATTATLQPTQSASATPTPPTMLPTATMSGAPTSAPTQLALTVTPSLVAATTLTASSTLIVAATSTAMAASTVTPTATATTAAVMLADTHPYIKQPPLSVTAMVGLPVEVEVKVWTATPLLQPTIAAASMVEPQPVNSEPAAGWYIFGWHTQPNLWWLVYAAVPLLVLGAGWLLAHKQIVTKKKLQTVIANLKQRTNQRTQP